jgi:hypothetical protein
MKAECWTMTGAKHVRRLPVFSTRASHSSLIIFPFIVHHYAERRRLIADRSSKNYS